MSLGTLLQRGPHLLDLSLIQLRRTTGGRTSAQGVSAALLPYPSPPPHALVADLQQPCDLSTRAALPEQFGRPYALSLGQLRPLQRRNDRPGGNRRRHERHNIRLPPTSPPHPPNLRKDQ
ncbi:protein of unknown function [Streptomyces sp. KY75]|nr:protein of unknown function [Streptomyces sp. KY75]